MANCIFAGVLVSFLFYVITIIVLKIYQKKALPPYIILTSKNSQDTIEGIIRTHIGMLSKFGTANFMEIIVLDLGSDDQTLTILSKLSRRYPFVRIALRRHSNKIT